VLPTRSLALLQGGAGARAIKSIFPVTVKQLGTLQPSAEGDAYTIDGKEVRACVCVCVRVCVYACERVCV